MGVFPFPSKSIGYGISKAQLGDSYNIWKKSLKRGPSYTAIGLERAGINRILAAGGGIGATSAAGSVKSNAAGGGESLDNPSIGVASARALSAQTKLTNTNQQIADQVLGRETLDTEYRVSDEGRKVYGDRMHNESLPQTNARIISQGAGALIDRIMPPGKVAPKGSGSLPTQQRKPATFRFDKSYKPKRTGRPPRPRR